MKFLKGNCGLGWISRSHPFLDEEYKGDVTPLSQEGGAAPPQNQPSGEKVIREIPVEQFTGQSLDPALQAPAHPEDGQKQPKTASEDILKSGTFPQIISNSYDVFSRFSPEQQKAFLDNVVNLAIKAPVAGASSVLDLFTTFPLNAAVSAYNALAPEGKALPYAETFEKKAEQGVDYLAKKAGVDTSQGGALYEGAKMAASVAMPGGIAKHLLSAPKTAKVLNTIGSVKPGVVMGAAGAGTAMELAREHEAGIAKTLGAGVAGAAVGEALPFVLNKKTWKDFGEKVAIRALGADKKNLKTEVVDSAKRLGIDLPLAATTDSVFSAFANQTISKTPVVGDLLRDKVKETSRQFQEAWDHMLTSVAPELKEPLSKVTRSIYERSNALVKDSKDMVSVQPILNVIQSVRKELKSPVYSEEGLALQGYMKQFEKSADKVIKEQKPRYAELEKIIAQSKDPVLGDLVKNLNQIKIEPYLNINELINTKINLNEIMANRKVFTSEESNVFKFLEVIQGAVHNVLERYGQTNPEWGSAFKTAEETYARHARREGLEKLLAEKVVNPVTQEVSYNPLIKILESRSRQKFLQESLGAENYKKLEDFVNVARGMEATKRNILNPSGTAIVGAVLGLVQGAVFGIEKISDLFPMAAAGGFTWGISKLLRSPQFLDIAREFAARPSVPLARKVDRIVKDRLGVGAQALMRGTQGTSENNN